MKKRNEVRLYNVIFPLYFILYFPNPFWVIAIPLNYVIDSLVLRLGLKLCRIYENKEERRQFINRTAWRLCIAGFAADFLGILFLIYFPQLFLSEQLAREIASAQFTSPFVSWNVLAVFLTAIVFSGICIYLIDRWILKKQGLDAKTAGKIALLLAVLTAPYLMLYPTELFMNYGTF
ncbi:MAG: hypothetical protein Q4D15_00010 [Lachnospiraceae bacterium]|nr:hypothetical protein [Lachnospiraceae bacterium]